MSDQKEPTIAEIRLMADLSVNLHQKAMALTAETMASLGVYAAYRGRAAWAQRLREIAKHARELAAAAENFANGD